MDPADIAGYLHITFQNAVRPVSFVHYVAPDPELRVNVASAFLEGGGGGLMLEQPDSEPTTPLPLIQILEVFSKKGLLALVAKTEPFSLFPGFEEVRCEAFDRGVSLFLATPHAEDLKRMWHEAEATQIIRAVHGPRDLRIATLSDWDRARLSIPLDGSKPQLLSKDSQLTKRTQGHLNRLFFDRSD